jgi:hypothetical protein
VSETHPKPVHDSTFAHAANLSTGFKKALENGGQRKIKIKLAGEIVL